MDAGQILNDLTDRVRADAALIQSGARAAEQRFIPALRNLDTCYRKALKDDQTKMPTYLHAALEAAALLIPPEPVFTDKRADWEKDQQGRYDMGPDGARLRPGT